MLHRLLVVVTVVAAPLLGQAAQLVGPIINASQIIAVTPGFGPGGTTVGACRDNQGNYWTTHKVGGVTYLIRIGLSGVVTGIIPTSYGTSTNVSDLAFDGQRDRVWMVANNEAPRVYSSLTGQLETNGLSNQTGYGIAWDGGDRVLVAGHSGSFDAATFQWSSPTLPLGTPPSGIIYSGLICDPSTASYWIGDGNSADPQGLTQVNFRQHPLPGQSMPPDLAFPSATSGWQGGALGGCEAWQDPSTGEWFGVFCQRVAAGSILYTARLGSSTGGSCGGPRFSRGPSVVQSQLFADASNASGFAWLIVGFGYASITVPLFEPGCPLELDPTGAVVLGAYLPSFSGNVSGQDTVPVSPSLHELPLYFQWATLDFLGAFRLSEGRSAAIKQF